MFQSESRKARVEDKHREKWHLLDDPELTERVETLGRFTIASSMILVCGNGKSKQSVPALLQHKCTVFVFKYYFVLLHLSINHMVYDVVMAPCTTIGYLHH